jgi:glycine oxidase
MSNFDCIVVGNGSVGSAIAYELSKNASKEFKIGIFGKNSREGSASLAAGAMINVFGEIEYDSLSSRQNETRFKMLLNSKDLWNNHILNLKEKTKTNLQIKKGTVILNNSSSDELDDENFKSIENALKKFKEKYSLIDSKDIKGYNPQPKFRSLKSLYIPNENSINSAKELLSVYDQIFQQKKNIFVFNSNIKKINIKKNFKEVIDESKNRYTCKYLVIAAGSYSQKLIQQVKQIKNKVPDLFFGTGNAIIVKSEKNNLPNCVIRTPNRGMACGLHVVPLNKNHIYVGATNRISTVPNNKPLISTTSTIINSLVKEINQEYGILKIKKICVGHRPTTSDTFPLLGETTVKGLFIATGTKRDGLSLSLYISKCISNMILKQKNNYNFPTIFKPERKIISTMTSYQAIEKSVKHRLSAAFQHELQIPLTETVEVYKENLRTQIKDIYKAAKLKKGVPPEMLNMYLYKKIRNK